MKEHIISCHFKMAKAAFCPQEGCDFFNAKKNNVRAHFKRKHKQGTWPGCSYVVNDQEMKKVAEMVSMAKEVQAATAKGSSSESGGGEGGGSSKRAVFSELEESDNNDNQSLSSRQVF